MIMAYSAKSFPSAKAIADASDGNIILQHSSGYCDINWGRSWAKSILNHDITHSTNKRIMRELFRENDVPMPELIPMYEVDRLGFWGFPIVGRPDKHMKGRGYWFCQNQDDIFRALRGTRRKAAATHFMEFIDAPREYRVHIFQGKSIRISEKEFFIDENGKKDYTTKKPGDIKLRRVREAAKQALEAIGLDFGAVDILARGADNAEVWVLEVNASPGLGGTMPQVYARTFLNWFNKEIV